MKRFFYPAITCGLLLILGGCASSKKTSTGTEIIVKSETPPPVVKAPDAAKINSDVNYAELQKKYAAFLKITPDEITNIKLYQFIDSWLNTPYKWGGMDRHGIDCSAFMQKLLSDVYGIYIPRTSVEQFFADWIDRFGSRTELSEGDLVFFKTMKGKAISHVGLYLGNHMFVNSSSSKGVSLGSLEDGYWKTKYVAAGRIKLGKLNKLNP
ncbi:MAG: C40 family peptidase [Gemmatimonadaceae bacterium]|nr:C40 family peptidase [Chitinophagaceae bacterium]